jgi:methyl-accepting chemotaxis protein
MIRQLLQGAASAQKAGMGLGQQIEQMANGLDIIKNAGINDADIEFIAGSIGRLSKALNSFAVNNEKRYKGVVQAVQMLQMLGSIDERTIDNIENLSSVNVSSIKNIVELISSLNFKGLTKK